MRILVVDDDPVALKLISSLLADQEYDVITATSVREAVSQLDKAFVDLIICDIMARGTAGLQFLKLLKSNPRLVRIPIILCTALKDSAAVSRSIELGAKDYILKPVNRDALLTKVRKALEQRPKPVLIVDDEKLIRSLLSRTVEREGLKAITASSAEEALELLESTKVGMVISDIVMGGMNGLELAAKIKEKHPTMPVLLVTGHSERFAKEHALEAGADGYITKPFKNVEIAQKLTSYL